MVRLPNYEAGWDDQEAFGSVFKWHKIEDALHDMFCNDMQLYVENRAS